MRSIVAGLGTIAAMAGGAIVMFFFAFRTIATEPGYETVLVDKPYVFGSEGVRPETQKQGRSWYWFSTEGIQVPVTPVKIDEPMEDVNTKSTSVVDLNSYITHRITDPAALVDKFGANWYQNNVKERYRTIVRNRVREYTFEQILTDATLLKELEKNVEEDVRGLAAALKLPVVIEDVSIGRPKPNAVVMEEIDRTAAQQQRKKTMVEFEQAETARKSAEERRAEADRAYQQKMGYSEAQFIQLRTAELFSEACRKGSCVIVNGQAPIAIPAK
jgi:regulator of protease activity HflC (stomatin/prohibitin superfamily)